jgi:hypothetical protein
MLLRAAVPTTIAGCVALLAYLDDLARDADDLDSSPVSQSRNGLGLARIAKAAIPAKPLTAEPVQNPDPAALEVAATAALKLILETSEAGSQMETRCQIPNSMWAEL